MICPIDRQPCMIHCPSFCEEQMELTGLQQSPIQTQPPEWFPLQPASKTSNPLKFMAPGHFCPDVCGLEDFGEADYMRGKVVRGFFRLMRLWPKPTRSHVGFGHFYWSGKK